MESQIIHVHTTCSKLATQSVHKNNTSHSSCDGEVNMNRKASFIALIMITLMTARPRATIFKVIRPTGDLITTDYHDSELLCKAQSACIACYARGSGGMPPQKNFENRCSKIEFGGGP